MPNGPTHRKLTKIATGVGIGTFFYLGISTEIWLLREISWFSLGVLTTLYFDPDLDLRHRLGYVGNAIGLELYQKIVPHRAGITSKSWREFSKKDWWRLFLFSHLPFLGTLPRLLILVTLTAPIYLAFSMIERYPIYGILWLYLGMSYSDVWHSLADLFTSGWKQRVKKKDKYKNNERSQILPHTGSTRRNKLAQSRKPPGSHQSFFMDRD